MPFIKGQRKVGGRKKGTRNKDAAPVIRKAEELGIDPFKVLLLFAAGDWQKLGYKQEGEYYVTQYGKKYEYTIEPSVRARAAAEAAQYLYPKLRSIEVEDKTIRERPLEDLTDEELDKL